MDQSKQNAKYPKPGQSNKARISRNLMENVLHSNSDQSITCGFQPQTSQHGTGGLVRSKPCREIYRPPNCRKGKNHQNYYSFNTLSTTTVANEAQHLNHSNNKNHPDLQDSSIAAMNVPGNSCPENNAPKITTGFRALNIHAKEFHFNPTVTTSAGTVRLENEIEENKTPYYGIVATAESSEIVQPQPPSFYSLYQSKSSGHIADMSPEQNNNLTCTEENNAFQDFSSFSNDGPCELNISSRLKQSKSSGNIPARSKVVRFDDEIQKNDTGNGIFDQLLNSTNSLRIAGENSPINAYPKNFEGAPPRMPFLQKSRTTVHMGISSHANVQLSEYPDYIYRNYQPQQKQAFIPSSVLIRNPNCALTTLAPAAATQLKRSKSFNAQNKHFGNSGEILFRSSGISAEAKPVYPPHSNFDDFCIKKWPKTIQELLNLAVTGGDRVPARNRMQLVTNIFEVLLEDKGKNNIGKNGEIERTGEWYNLTIPAVHIFLYFIQREKDHTVIESLMNTCYAIFQSLSNSPKPESPQLQPGSHPKWSVFLSFLCAFYCQVKVSRIQQNVRNSTDRVSMTFLALLCDSCLATIRSLPTCHSPEIMDCLFTVMTSIGRDMEKSFPQKMKQILTSVRDALLGLGPYEALAEASPIVQKTLMQLIELHAANWHLPASAVRYYYAHPNTHADQSNQS